MSKYGKASNELFTQFVARIAQEIPSATLAMFSKLKYVNAPNFEKFRDNWNAEYKGGFIVHSKSFEGLKGDFPIGFLIWKMNQNGEIKTPIIEISTEVLDKKVNPIGEKKFYNLPNETFLNVWIDREKSNNEQVIPLKGAVSTATNKTILSNWSNGAIAYLWCKANDMQNVLQTVLVSSTWGDGHGFYVNSENLWQITVIFTVRRIIKPTWINDRDQFLQPTGELTDEFKNDCLIWMLFNGSNLTASANDLEWNDRKWSIVNHFIPFTEAEVGANERFESDFMVEYLRERGYPPYQNPLNPPSQGEVNPPTPFSGGEKDSSLDKGRSGGVSMFSPEAIAVMDAGRELWKAYFADTDMRAVRDELKLNRTDVGWYQVRNALKKRNESGDFPPVSFVAFEEAYRVLTEKLRPKVWELGFLRG